jgi:hypothetical protein
MLLKMPCVGFISFFNHIRTSNPTTAPIGDSIFFFWSTQEPRIRHFHFCQSAEVRTWSTLSLLPKTHRHGVRRFEVLCKESKRSRSPCVHRRTILERGKGRKCRSTSRISGVPHSLIELMKGKRRSHGSGSFIHKSTIAKPLQQTSTKVLLSTQTCL